MPLRMEIKRLLSKGTDRVKSVDIHPTETWLLVSLYNGQVHIWNYKTESLVKSFEVSQQPVRCAKFIPRKQWIVAGADDLAVRVYNYNTMAKVKTFEAHNDYIRFLAIHPTQPLMLSSSDDMTIRLWNWEKNWQCMQTYEGHNHFVMMVTFNPKDPNTFASASLDRTIKVWGLGTSTAHFTLEGHDQGVNCVDYYTGGDKPYIVSGADDRLVKIWDYQNKTCVQTLDGHTHNVSVVAYHPSLPIIISGSEDTTVRIWNANTYRLEKSLNYGMDRVWALTCLKGSNKVAIGYDNGLSLIKLGREEPAVSMANNGKIIWAKNNEIQQLDIKTAAEVTDGERLALPTKELGTSEVFPQKLEHSSNGRFVVVCGDGEFTIFTSLAWRNKTFGTGVEFVWGVDTGEYAVRETNGKVKTYKNFKEHKTLRPSYNTEGIFGGLALGVRSPSFVCFYDWEELRIIRRIDVSPKAIYWNESGELLTIASESSFYILKYNRQAVQAAFDQSSEVSPDGIDDAFEVIQDFPERVRTGIWVGDCFIYTNSANRLNYCVGNEIVTIGHLDRVMYLLGYVAKQSRVYLTDKSLNIVSYRLDISIVNYQTAILRGDLGLAAKIFPEIPVDQRNRIAQFLESQGHKEQALEIATDPDLKFDLAIQLGHLDIAVSIARENDSEQKWRQLSDLSISKNRYDLAEVCLQQAQDLSGLLLLYTSFGDSAKVRELAEQAQAQSRNNISFMCYFLLNDLDKCIDLLCQTARIPEAAFMARTYLPSRVSEIVSLWKDNLKTVNLKAANSLADPDQYPNLFDNFELALKAERLFRKYAPVAASSYESWKGSLLRDLIADARDREEVNEEEEPVAIKAAPVSAPAPEPVVVAAVAVEPKEIKAEAPIAAKVEVEAEPEIDIDLVDATEKQVQELLEQEGGAEDEIVVDF